MTDAIAPDEIFPAAPEPEAEQKPKRKRAKKKLRGARGDHLTGREIKLLANYQDVLAGKITLAEATIKSGYCVRTNNAGIVGHRVLTNIQKNLSKNEFLQECLGLNGASLDDACKALGDSLKATRLVPVKSHAGNLEGVREVPDHNVRRQAAQFVIEAHNAMPEKKEVKEIRTYEQKVELIAEIKQRGPEGLKLLMEALERQKAKQLPQGGDE